MLKKVKPLARAELISSLDVSEFGLNNQQLIILHDLIKTNLLRDGVYIAHLENKDQLAISMDDGRWGIVGRLKTITVSYGEYSPAMEAGERDCWMASGTRYFPVHDKGVDDAVMVFMSRLFTKEDSISLTYANIDSYSLEDIKAAYMQQPELLVEAEENFSYLNKEAVPQ